MAEPSGPNAWSRTGHFKEISTIAGGGYEMIFADRGRWLFRPIDGTPAGGRIEAIEDRNGNRLSFGYDQAGLLTGVTDTLDRAYTIAYTPAGQVASVTDFSGRVVEYVYFGAGDPDGPAGDLMSVRSPVVVGTSTGNDFPEGRTTSYSYTAGFSDDDQNHNLTAVTDAMGRTFVENEYDGADRVVRQRWGDPGDVIDVVYETVTPKPTNAWAVHRVWVNDREGHVSELLYDSQNRLVSESVYAGQADADLPTSEDHNRPGPPLRDTEPERYERRWEYNDESLVSRIMHPNGNEEVFTYDLQNADPRLRGNLRQHKRIAGPLGGDQTSMTEYYYYEPSFGGCCGSSFVTRSQDAKGRSTYHEYDNNGNRTRTTHRLSSIVEDWAYNEHGQVVEHFLPADESGYRRRDTYEYFDSGPSRGYLRAETIDADGLALTTMNEYDARGNVIARIDPNGRRTEYEVNALDELVRVLHPVLLTDAGQVRYEEVARYDAVGNLVEEAVVNFGANGVADAKLPWIRTRYDYDILDRVVRATQDADAGVAVVTEYAYDANGNRVEVRRGEAVNGNDPHDVVRTVFDTRDLPMFEVRAPGDTADESVTRFDYDGNGSLVATIAGYGSMPRRSETVYDGFDRPIAEIDPMGNRTVLRYDANGNKTREQHFGELDDLPGDSSNVRMAESVMYYDAMDRMTRRDVVGFDPRTQASLPLFSSARTDLTYSGTSRVISIRDPLGHTTRWSYDSADRLLSREDARGDATLYEYDSTSNVTAITSREVSDTDSTTQSFTTLLTYDALDRITTATDSAGNVRTFGYDSRGNAVVELDGRGNRVARDVDGLGRLTSTIRSLTADGTGASPIVDEIVTRQVWDDSSRLIERIDAGGHATLWLYDSQGRPVGEARADGTGWSLVLSVHGDLIVAVDENVRSSGQRSTLTPTSRGIDVGPGVRAQHDIRAVRVRRAIQGSCGPKTMASSSTGHSTRPCADDRGFRGRSDVANRFDAAGNKRWIDLA
ncbi:MAG: hypothetical protein R3B49_03695 [Phycisphaerales bacterium]